MGNSKLFGWNYRVLRQRTPDGDTHLQIHEVYYNKKGRPYAATENGIAVGGATRKEMQREIERMRRALSKPILDFELFKKKK